MRHIQHFRAVRSFLVFTLVLFFWTATNSAFAQGQDGTRGERNLQVIAEMLPGGYDNANQAYFDRRLKVTEDGRHSRFHAKVEKTSKPELGSHVFEYEVSDPEGDSSKLLFVLGPDDISNIVRMKIYQPDGGGYLEHCDLLWKEEAGQFRAVSANAKCRSPQNVNIPSGLLLSEDALWVTFHKDDRDYYTLERIRNFSCYIDVPGVGGGRDIPYKRYQIEDIHDKGGKQWVMLDDGMELSISLQNIRWPMNNLENIFTRHSFVMYIGKKEDGEEKEITYAWTVPKAQRIGVNLKWMLVNCFMLNNEDVTPFFKDEPIL